jgi:hypothetical protein
MSGTKIQFNLLDLAEATNYNVHSPTWGMIAHRPHPDKYGSTLALGRIIYRHHARSRLPCGAEVGLNPATPLPRLDVGSPPGRLSLSPERLCAVRSS